MKNNNFKLIALGLVTGLVNGLFGSGGGMIIVPALIFILGLKEYKAHATAISIIFPLTIISTIVYFFNNTIPLKIGFLVMIGALLGSYIGAKVLNKIPAKILRKAFGCVIIYTAVRMIWI
ncbi:sulfite exporter TauE/SafE family protein [Tissierella sp. Yu-01]|uniref:sulfite exporter TauE/SafE family protein n=1 Tax=Tissierella sp. Yu-01 TaxID=3035694 RepID=UPI00240D914E|nr:sulfite exporter TauE/SafE family protein [Tissierella sp. Yu-01]WFA09611.1 sulfite exporter TauE/SafE family protein [Tissierella sp. Yu-01]